MTEHVKIFCRGCHAKYDVSDLPPFTEFTCPNCGIVLRTPEKFGSYLLEKICGHGGMSKIYRAIDPKHSRRVAVKIMELSPEVSDLEKHFIREAELMKEVSHPAVVPILDHGKIGNKEFMVMPYYESGDLESAMKAGNLPDTVSLLDGLRSVAAGLNYLYTEHRIVHHDIKPSNILRDLDWAFKIGDFDLADRRKPGDSATPCPEWGSPGYISPERLHYGGEDFRGDIFSLGVTVYELLTGKTPFGISGEPEELYRRRSRPFTPLAELLPSVSENLSELIGRMLAFDPEARPSYPEIIRKLAF